MGLDERLKLRPWHSLFISLKNNPANFSESFCTSSVCGRVALGLHLQLYPTNVETGVSQRFPNSCRESSCLVIAWRQIQNQVLAVLSGCNRINRSTASFAMVNVQSVLFFHISYSLPLLVSLSLFLIEARQLLTQLIQLWCVIVCDVWVVGMKGGVILMIHLGDVERL